MKDFFRKFSQKTFEIMGSPVAFISALILLLLWGASGPLFDFSDTWQLVINTTTTIITLLMVFIIQNTQNRDAKSTHLKLDELILSTHRARNIVGNLDDIGRGKEFGLGGIGEIKMDNDDVIEKWLFERASSFNNSQ